MPIKAVNRIVSAEGNYSAIYIARDQKIADEKIADLDVRLLKLSSGHGVLVARDIDKNVVGEVNDPMPADALMVGANLRTLTIPTRLPAVNAGISSCQ